jgi:hypothetical protein
VTGVDTSSLSPSDAVVALRSFPRRYREATQLEPGESERRLYETPGILTTSVLDQVVSTVRTLTLIQRALEETLVTDVPAVHAAIRDRRLRDFDTVAHGSMDDVLAELADVSPAFADRVDGVATDDWVRRATVVGNGEVTALELVQEAVSTAADNLRDVEVTLRQLRGR